jgi:hypothetical protein
MPRAAVPDQSQTDQVLTRNKDTGYNISVVKGTTDTGNGSGEAKETCVCSYGKQICKSDLLIQEKLMGSFRCQVFKL